MRIDQQAALSTTQRQQSLLIASKLVELRAARRIRQSEAAIRSGLSRTTVQRLEKGDPGGSIGALIRYIDAIAPGLTLQKFLEGSDPSVISLSRKSLPQRVRGLSPSELKEIDF